MSLSKKFPEIKRLGQLLDESNDPEGVAKLEVARRRSRELHDLRAQSLGHVADGNLVVKTDEAYAAGRAAQDTQEHRILQSPHSTR